MRTPAIVMVFFAASCNVDPASTADGLTGFLVQFEEGQDLGQTTPLAFMDTGGVDLRILVTPVGAAFSGWVTVKAEPGEISRVAGAETSGQLVRLDLAEGEQASFTVTVVMAYSSTHIWVVDEGMTPGSALCSDGMDNDGDGLVDEMQDPGCASATDGSEEGGGGAMGVSPTVRFVNPRVADVQGGASSPLEGSAVVVDRGRLVVTAIGTDGFFVTDIDPAAPAGGPNNLFVFNYSTPWGLRECDIVTDLSGIVGEFFGYTELTFPSWTVVDPDSRVPVPTSSAECPIPSPEVLDATVVTDYWDMESLEAGLVRIVGGRIGDTFIDCDLDHDGVVAFDGPEGGCADSCSLDAECTEINTYFSYGQYAVVLDGCRGTDCQKIWAVTRHAVPDFWADHHDDEVIASLTGTLRHIEFLDPEWILEIRCADDLVVEGSPVPDHLACVPPYARGEHYDNN